MIKLERNRYEASQTEIPYVAVVLCIGSQTGVAFTVSNIFHSMSRLYKVLLCPSHMVRAGVIMLGCNNNVEWW